MVTAFRLVVTVMVATGLGLVVGGTRAYEIPTDSMIPTLEIGDRILVDVMLAPQSRPQRGEIWVFNNPDPTDTAHRQLVKRVVAVPGDRVSVAKGKLQLNNTDLDEPYAIGEVTKRFKPIKLSPLMYWVMGDNRTNSKDSTEWGPVHRSALTGRAVFRFAPITRIRML